jgi:2-C-methyl-D-erythritol 4-phosphate cytidylyltransferase
MNQYVIIVAGGSGQRMQSVIPKQFLELAGKPILFHTLNKFVQYNPEIDITIVLPEYHINTWKELIKTHNYPVKHTIVCGGEIRFNSVKNGLNAIPNEGLVAVHDGVRPLVSLETIHKCFIDAELYGNAIPCIPIYETVRRVTDMNSRLEDRSALRLIQTPQVFKINLLKQAYNQSYKPQFTDDASVVENMGEQIHLVEGNRENIKITDPLDLVLAQAILKNFELV